MNHPRAVIDIAARAAARHSDAQNAIEEAAKEISELPDYDQFVTELVRTAVSQLVYDARHRTNVAIRKQSGKYGQPPKVLVAQNKSVQQVMTSYYSYAISGTALGMIFGKDLPTLAANESALADGHRFNARLLTRLRALVPLESMVQDVVPESKLASLFKEINHELSR